MKSILVIGAGRSASSLISYLLTNAAAEQWQVRVGDMSAELAAQKTAGHPAATAFAFDINNETQREAEISRADLVVSMLPAFMHGSVARDCVRLGKHLVTASYVSDEMRSLDAEARAKGILLLNEIGLDPGLDHLSAMQIIDTIHARGGNVTAFYSYCGGLVAPESNDNPWGYKFSWNPRNVILAGQGTAQYIENGTYKYLPYSRVFAQAGSITVEGYGTFDAYANRDSLSYRAPYGLDDIPTILRGTLRMPGYCKAWNIFVQLGLTDDTWKIKEANKLTYAQLINAFLPAGEGTLRKRLADFAGLPENDPALEMVAWTGVLNEDTIPLEEASPAQILQQLLERKWVLRSGDKDMIVMQHIFRYEINGTSKELTSSLVVKGDDEVHTAMAKTVGLPAAIAVKMILNGSITLTGVQIPVMKAIYEPVLAELRNYGIVFTEKE